MVAWGKGAHAVEAFKFSLYLAIPAIMTVAVAQNDKNLFGVIDYFQYIKYPAGQAVTRAEMDAATSKMIAEVKEAKRAKRMGEVAGEAVPAKKGWW